MRRILLFCALFLALPHATARADTLLDFTLTGPGTVVTFTLPEHPFFPDALHLVEVGTRTSATLNGVSGYTADLTFLTNIAPASGASLTLDVFSLNPTLTVGLDLALYGPIVMSLYYGSDYPPPPGYITGVFYTGSSELSTFPILSPVTYYTLNVVPEATTPEPSTLALLLIGAASLIAARRGLP